MNFNAAEKYCKSLGANLIEFSTKAQYEFLIKSRKTSGRANSKEIWIGLKQKHGVWYWVHSKKKLNSIFQNRVRGTGGGEKYQNIYHGSNTWDSEGPNENNVPVCQKTSF